MASASKRVEAIAAVADGLRHQHGLSFAQVHRTFCQVLGFEISLAAFDLIRYAADEGFSGVPIPQPPQRTPPQMGGSDD